LECNAPLIELPRAHNPTTTLFQNFLGASLDNRADVVNHILVQMGVFEWNTRVQCFLEVQVVDDALGDYLKQKPRLEDPRLRVLRTELSVLHL
jgi:hypothetical protein